jgi:hypothetical protein
VRGLRCGLTVIKDPRNKRVEFFFGSGLLDYPGAIFPMARAQQQVGYPVKLRINPRDHGHQDEDYEFFACWLQENWVAPDPAARPAPPPVADPLPVLTPEALAQMTTFWTRFTQQPDSILFTARRAHLREVTVPVGKERPSVVLVDMPALASQYPSVAAALKEAGLTALQHDAYRAALISAMVAVLGDSVPSPEVLKATRIVAPPTTTVEGKNIAFLGEHWDELQALEEKTHILRMP